MRGKTELRGLCLALALVGLLAGCGKGYKQIVVINEGAAEFVTIGKAPEELSKEPQEVWVPGRTLVFRTDSAVPGAPGGAQGKAGRVYRINDNREMEEVGEFELSIPNDSLAYRWGT